MAASLYGDSAQTGSKAVCESALYKIGSRSEPYPPLITYHSTLITYRSLPQKFPKMLLDERDKL